MLTLIATAIGFISSAFPDVMKMYKEKQDRKHDIKILEMKMESMKLGHDLSMQELNAKADVSETTALYDHASLPSNIGWVEGLRASVRPILTYAFFILFAFIKVSILIVLVKEGASIFQAATYIWDPETAALFAAVITFWFGHRALQRHKELNK
jgi:hypothetical protein